VQPVHVASFSATLSGPDHDERQPLVRCPHFHLDYQHSVGAAQLGGIRQMQVLIVLQGQGRLLIEDAAEEIRQGHVWLLPASMPQGECRPQATLKTLLCTLP
jgi:hypothetical protein